MKEPSERVRWWPAALILAAAAVGIAAQWLLASDTRQWRVLRSGGIAVGAGLLLLVWLVFGARLSARARRRSLGALALVGLALIASVEWRGFSGDMVPILRWRFGAPAAEPSRTAVLSQGPQLDSPQLRGPARDGRIAGVSLARDWQARPPLELWRTPVGAGWAGFAVAGDDAITLEQRGDEEAVVCYALRSGEERWSHAYAARFDHPLGGLGPRTTPTIADERVYTLGATGVLCALDRANGELLWQRALLEPDEVPEYGASGSPLALGERVVVMPGPGGRSIGAFAAADGAPLWSAGEDAAAYASPMLAELAGAQQLLAFNAGSLAAHDPESGAILWSVPWSDRQPNVAQPLVMGDSGIVVSSGYGVGAARYELARDAQGGFEARELWRSRALKAKFASYVERDGALYGLDDGVLACVDAATGERRWKGGRYGHGQLLLVGDLLLIAAEDGDVVLAEATPREHVELGRVEVLGGKTWNPPALATPYLLMRNDQEAVCLELPLAQELGD